MLLAILLAGCASAPTPAPNLSHVANQRLVLDGVTGEHLLLDVDSAQARALTTGHPGRLERAADPTPGVVTLGNVSIPLALGAARAPGTLPVASIPEESSP